MRASRTILGVGALLASALTVSARADDWRQFRKDEFHSAVTKDRVPLPLTEVWNWSGALGVSHALAYEGAVFTSGDVPVDARRYRPMVISLDLRTGVPRWFREAPGAAQAPHGILTLNEGGSLFAIAPTYLAPQEFKRPEDPQGGERPTPPVRPFVAFNSRDGRSIPLASALGTPEEPQPILLTRYAHLIGGPIPVIGPLPDAEQGAYSPPLAIGRDLWTFSCWDMVLRWTLEGLRPNYSRTRLWHSCCRIKGPSNFPLVPIIEYRGYPACSTNGGVFMAADFTNPCAFVVRPNGTVAWHNGYFFPVGIASSNKSSIFLPAGLNGARETLIRLDAESGRMIWAYPSPPANSRAMYARSRIYDPKAAENQIKSAVPPKRMGNAARPRRVHPSELLSEERSTVAYMNPAGNAHAENPGLVVWQNLVIGETLSKISAVDINTGKGRWVHKLEEPAELCSLIGTADHLLIAFRQVGRPYLRALRYTDGKELWTTKLSTLGKRAELLASDGVILLADGASVRALAPAERTFRLAVDSDDPKDYRLTDVRTGQRLPVDEDADDKSNEKPAEDEQDADRLARAAKAEPVPTVTLDTAIGDASVLRFAWGTDPEEMVRRVVARRRLIGTRPLLVTLDWLSPAREQVLGQGGRGWDAAGVARFAETCGRIARAGATHLDIAPEFNVYLLRYPSRLNEVLGLVKTAQSAVKRSAETRVLASCNAEVMLARYGKTRQLPFGDLPSPGPAQLAAIQAVAAELDLMGLTLRPRSGFEQEPMMPRNYLLAAKELLGDRPLAITSMSIWMMEGDSLPEAVQAAWVRKLFQAAYYLDSPLVACPELSQPGTPAGTASFRVGKTEKEALGAWRYVLNWTPVRKLSSQISGKGAPRERPVAVPESPGNLDPDRR